MISLIATIFNERDNLEKWLDGLLHQIKLPDEIVIVDGGSDDGTWERLVGKAGEYTIFKIFQHKGNIASGRNYAIRQAQGDIIAVTDAGCVYEPAWLEKLVAPFAGGAVWSATGFGPWFKEGDNLLFFLIAAATIPAPSEFQKDWLPSSRSVAFKKEIWQKAGGYPEWIPICEDIIFDLKIKKLGTPLSYAREPLVFWRPRTSLGAYFKQLYKYTKSDGHGKLWLSRQLVRYGVYGASLALLILTVFVDRTLLIILFAGAMAYMFKFWKRWAVFSKDLSVGKKIVGYILLPFIIAFGDMAKMCGWPVGVWERMRGKIKFEKY
jgi:glycosyltransferase involved in cell wall biosynthesis